MFSPFDRLKEILYPSTSAAAANMANNDEEAVGETIFGRMLTGQEPSKFIYEDEQCVAFDDINPTGE